VLGAPPVMLAGAWGLAGASALEDDLIYYLPQRAFFGAALRGGELPLWNPHVAMGYASAADPQVGTWYPATYLFALFDVTPAYPLTICLHFAWAGWGMYRLLRWMGRDWTAALFGALAFEFCGFLVAHRVHLTMHHAAAWTPWIIWGWGRYATTLRARHLAMAVLCTGVQLLVQHVQVSIITCTVVAGYVLHFGGRRVFWRLVGGMALAAGVAAIQIVPTYFVFGSSTRSTPLYERFTENSFEPGSLALLVFPMLYGSRTPGFYPHDWWGPSHLCEQTAYASLAVLVFAVAAALALWRRDRHVRFWVVAGVVCLALAFGKYNPVSRLLFLVPVFSPLRVPARWLLMVNVALTVLAASGVDALLRGGVSAAAVRHGLRRLFRYGLPVVVLGALALMVVVRWRHRDDGSMYGRVVTASLSPHNVAILIPLALTMLTTLIVWRVSRSATSRLVGVLIGLMLVDLATFAAFNDVDRHTYRDARVLEEQPLADWLAAQADPERGRRLWVPRERADYARPLEVLWPMSNMLFGVDSLQAYTPLTRLDQRLVLGFKPWGASETAASLLRNPGLLRALSVRWVAARTTAERALVVAGGGPDDAADWVRVGIKDGTEVVAPGPGVAWPVRVDAPGLYGVQFTATPHESTGVGRWFVVLEAVADGRIERVAPELVFEPVDLAAGPRPVRCYFRCQRAVGGAQVRVYTYFGRPLEVAEPVFARVADVDAGSEAFVKRWESPDGVTVHELMGSRPRAYLAEGITPVASAGEAVERLTSDAETMTQLPRHVVVEGLDGSGKMSIGPGRVRIVRDTRNRLEMEVTTDRGGYLVVADTFDAGWSATIDGRNEPIYRTNSMVRGMIVPPGTHRVVMRYWPRGLTVGLAVTLLSLAMVGGMVPASRGRQA